MSTRQAVLCDLYLTNVHTYTRTHVCVREYASTSGWMVPLSLSVLYVPLGESDARWLSCCLRRTEGLVILEPSFPLR